MRSDEYRDPVPDTEAEGLPGTADDESTAYDDVDTVREPDGHDPASLPSDRPVAIDRYGTTPGEAQAGTPLDDRLAAELPDEDPLAEASPERPEAEGRTTGQAPTTDLPGRGDVAETGPDFEDRSAPDVDPRSGEPVDPLLEDRSGEHDPLRDETDGEPLDPVLDDWAATENRTAEESVADAEGVLDRDVLDQAGRDDLDLDARPGSVGRLVAPDEGAHPDREADEIAYDAGQAGGGASAEEAAMHLEQPPS